VERRAAKGKSIEGGIEPMPREEAAGSQASRPQRQ
jgi:hypothetical protein